MEVAKKNIPAGTENPTGIFSSGIDREKSTLYFYQFILPTAQSNLLSILESAFPVGIGVDVLEELVVTMGVFVVAAA